MKLIGNLRSRWKNTNSKEEARGLIEKAGMSVNDGKFMGWHLC